jgi:signal transduction histidine kinase
MTARLQPKLMLSFVVFTLAVCALFGLFAMAFVYTVEDRFIERALEAEAVAQREHRAAHGRWAPPGAPHFSLHESAATLPADMEPTLRAEPQRREVAGSEGRHYHAMALGPGGQPPWLVVEASSLLMVRPVRQQLVGWLLGWGVAVAAAAALLAWIVARDFEALLARTRGFLAREQAFTRDASHELRTPLAVLRLAIERALARPGLTPQARAELAPMQAATRLLEQTVTTLLLQAREDPGRGAPGTRPEPVAVLPLAEEWVLAHAAWLDTQPLALDMRLGRHDAVALPAPVLQLALANLLGNALAHGQPGGRVRVWVEGGALCVANPGPAAPPPGAGDPFVKGEGSAGFGLGLSILRRLLEQHGSRLEVAHQAGETCVRVVPR